MAFSYCIYQLKVMEYKEEAGKDGRFLGKEIAREATKKGEPGK